MWHNLPDGRNDLPSFRTVYPDGRKQDQRGKNSVRGEPDQTHAGMMATGVSGHWTTWHGNRRQRYRLKRMDPLLGHLLQTAQKSDFTLH